MSWPADLGSLALLYISQEASLLVDYNVRVLIELQDSNVTRITCREFLVGLDLLPSLRGTGDYVPQTLERFMVELGSLLISPGLDE